MAEVALGLGGFSISLGEAEGIVELAKLFDLLLDAGEDVGHGVSDVPADREAPHGCAARDGRTPGLTGSFAGLGEDGTCRLERAGVHMRVPNVNEQFEPLKVDAR